MPHQIVSRNKWLAEHKALARQGEEAFTKERDALSKSDAGCRGVKI